MSHKLVKAAGICLALIGAAALPTHAFAQAAAAPSGDSQTIARDANGKLRAATAEELAELGRLKAAKARANGSRIPARGAIELHHESGAEGMVMSDDTMSASVAVINKDGKVEQECFDSGAAAAAAVKSGVLTHTHSTKLETE